MDRPLAGMAITSGRTTVRVAVHVADDRGTVVNEGGIRPGVRMGNA